MRNVINGKSIRIKSIFRFLCLLGLIFLAVPHVFAVSLDGSLQSALTGLTNPKKLSVFLETFFVLAFISFLPSILIMTTSFLRMIIVLSFLRHALSLQNTPPNHVLVSLAIILTVFVMAPTWDRINEEAYKPYRDKAIAWETAVNKASVPLRDFLFKQTRKKELGLAVKLSRAEKPKNIDEVPFPVLATGFALSELKTAFQIGFIIFIPFLVIDLVVASVLMSMGMMMVPPSMISLPLKILLFVMIDGWSLLVRGMMESVR